MGRGGQGFQPRGMGRPDPDMPPPPDVRPFLQRSPEDVIRPVPPMQRRGMGGRERDLPEPKEDVVRPMQRRGMGRRGQDLPEPETVEPEPRRLRRRVD